MAMAMAMAMPGAVQGTHFLYVSSHSRSITYTGVYSRSIRVKSSVSSRFSKRFLAMAEDISSSMKTPEDSSSSVTTAVENAGEMDTEKGVQSEGTDEKDEAEKPRVVYPKGFTRYETMAVLRPDITEEQRLQLSQRYEEMIIGGGGMDVEIFNRGIMPLAYPIVKKNTRGEKNTYVDGIYYMFTYATKPTSINPVQKRLETDDDIIRVCTFKLAY